VGAWPREAFRAHGVRHPTARLDRPGLYLEPLALVNAGAIQLPDDDKLLRELRSLERRHGAAARDRVDHRPGQHDDRANAVAVRRCSVGRECHRSSASSSSEAAQSGPDASPEITVGNHPDSKRGGAPPRRAEIHRVERALDATSAV